MKTVYLIRHGESLANTGAKSMPNAEIPLTNKGLQQAQDLLQFWLARQNPPSAIIHSELLRAQQTAQVFAQHYDLKPENWEVLNELNCLSFQNIADLLGAERAILARNWWQNADLHHQDGDDADSFADFLARVDNFILQTNRLENQALIFGHGIWLGLLAWRLMNLPVRNNLEMQKFRQFQTAIPMNNTVVYQLDIFENGTKSLKYFQAVF